MKFAYFDFLAKPWRRRYLPLKYPTFFVYILKSHAFPDQSYVEYTTNIENRLAKHNAGDVASTRRYRPWALQTFIAFNDKDKALSFERYLKSGSGRAFAKKRF